MGKRGFLLVEQKREITPKIDVSSDSKLVNFSSWLYWQNRDQAAYIRKGVSSFLAESLLLPRVERVIVDPSLGFVDKDDGRVYNDVFDRAIRHYSFNEQLRDRFIAEKKGFDNSKKLIEFMYASTGELPPIVIASPPGEVYQASEKENTKSVTFVAIPEGVIDGRPEYILYTIPTFEIELEAHWSMVEKVSRVTESMIILNYGMENISPESVVAFPSLLEEMDTALEELAESLGFDNWADIEQKGNIASRFEREKSSTDLRRTLLISWFTNLISNHVSEGKNRREFDELDDLMRLVFAGERGGLFLTEDFEDLQQVTRYLESLVEADDSYGQYISDSRDYEFSSSAKYTPLASLYWWIMSNDTARDSYLGTGCGAGGFDMRNDPGSIAGGFENSIFTSNALFSGSAEVNSTTVKTGKYTEFYNYEPGECKNCKQHKPYVAHPKSREIQCAGWCSDCEK